ncbi:MAG: hypothetical protein IJB09_05735 [Oscillospiraceae bacterium]|nr:hypothetical protein [Oscillospiraceae bacterium]
MKKYTKRLICLTAAIVMLLAMGSSAFASNSGPLQFVTPLPPAVTLYPGQTHTLSVVVSGADNISYTWYANGTTIAGAANSPSLTATFSQDAKIYVVASANGYAISSNVCELSVGAGSGTGGNNPGYGEVLPSPNVPSQTMDPNFTGTPSTPTITQQPQGAKLMPGQGTTLYVGATCPNLGYGIQLQYQWYISNTNNAATAAPIAGATSASYTTPSTNVDKYYLCAVWSTNSLTNSSVVYSNLVGVTYGGNEFKITKQPTGETVNVGGSALFIARADNAVKHEWRIVSKDTSKTVPASQAGFYFAGLNVSGEGTDTLALSNIPGSMNEWSVECKFTAADGKTLYSNGAIIKVQGAVPTPTATPTILATPTPTASPAPTATVLAGAVPNPSIQSQPSGAVLSEGQNVTLSVSAAGEDPAKGVTLKYQWYRNTQNSNANGTPISGATGPTYVPDTISGSRYYYVGITATDGTTNSKTIYSSPATVTYTAPISTPTPAPSAAPSADANDKKYDRNPGLGSMLIGPIIAIVVAVIAIGVGMFFLLRSIGKDKDEPDRYYYDEDDDDKFMTELKGKSRSRDRDYYRDDEFDRRR